MLSSVKSKIIFISILLLTALTFACQKQTKGSEEICNEKDDDWNGLTDETFTDAEGNFSQIAHCGGCFINCKELLASAEEVACEGQGESFGCQIVSCPAGTHLTSETFCAPDGDIACLPCVMESDCQIRDPSTHCKSLPSGSKRCLPGCETELDTCPPGYICQPDGNLNFCYPASGFCSCNEFGDSANDGGPSDGAPSDGGAADGGLTFGCLVDNPDGTNSCEGTRTCEDGGLSPCEPLYEEICDGEDNNCDGLTDELFKQNGLYIDVMHCGSCNNPCKPLAAHTTASCIVDSDTPSCVRQCVEGYVDLDGAGINGCECAKSEAVWPPVALGTDLDCDGALDDTSAFVFVSKLGDDRNRGNMESPVLTINKGIEIAASEGKTVLVAQGIYEEQVELKPGVSLYGGYRTDFLERDTTLFEVTISGENSLPGQPILVANDIADPTEVEGFVLEGSHAVSPGAGSTAVLLSRCSEALTLQNLKIVAGKGGKGQDGQTSVEILASSYGGAKPADLDGIPGGNGASGFSADTRRCSGLSGNGGVSGKKVCPVSKAVISGGKGGNSSCPDTGCKIGSPCPNAGCTDYMVGKTCDFSTMLSQARPNPPAGNGAGPEGGSAGALTYDAPTTRQGSNFCDDNPTLLREGANGEAGGKGVDGEGGIGCADFAGSFDSNTGLWSAPGGTGGAYGTDGSGGGGGTQGNGYDVLQGAAWNYDDHLGGAGGGGGSGACGAPGAQAGGGGGSSIGVAIVLGKTGGPKLENVRIIPDRAGDGGAGGIGASGGAPGSGGQGGVGNFWCARTGGPGGDGGKGGHGGGGGGGCGGSISGFHLIPNGSNDGNAYLAYLKDKNTVDAPPAPGSGGRGGFSPGYSGTNGFPGSAMAFRIYGAESGNR